MKLRPRTALITGSLLIAGSLLSASPAVAEKIGSSSWMDAMHDSPLMQQMRDQMPADLQKKCDQMHDQMTEWIDQHPGGVPSVPGGMMSPGVTPGGMMGSGQGSLPSPGPKSMMGSGGMMNWNQ